MLHRLGLATAAALIASLAAAPAHADSDPLAAWHDALANAEADQANVVYLGSSTTVGAGASSQDRRYVNLVTADLGGGPVTRVASTYPSRETSPGVHGYNAGVGGATSETYVNSTTRPFIAWERPSLVVHMIGSNDSIDPEPYAVPVDEYQANVAAEVDRLDAATSQPMSHLLVHTFRRDTVSVAKWTTYREALERIAAERDNVAVLDISGAFEAADHLGADPHGLMSADGVHPSDAGHALAAELVAGFLMPVTEPTPEPIEEPTSTPTPEPEPSATPVPTQTTAAEPEPQTSTSASTSTPAPAPSAPTLSTPAAPRKVKAVRTSPRRTVVTWRTGAHAERYVTRCGRTEKASTGQRAVLRVKAASCSVRSVNAAGASRWVKVRVAR